MIYEATLVGANLQRAQMQDSRLSTAELKNCDLRGADLLGVVGAAREQIDEAITDNSTRLPDYLI